MKSLPPRPDIGHLKKQAKALLAAYRQADPEALRRFRAALPAARGRSDSAVTAQGLRLHDAQSCLAREHGFDGWGDLLRFVEARRAQADDPQAARLRWLRLVYDGDLAGGTNVRRPAVAARLLAEDPALADSDDPWLACATGDMAALRTAAQRDAGWVHRAGGPLALPPLVAVTHSGLAELPDFADHLRASAAFLVEAGASPNQCAGNRWPPASLATPDAAQPLSALYGAAGKWRDPALTALLLAAGADPDDGESLYHALESPTCTQALLAAGARIHGTNAIYRALDLDDAAPLRLLLAHGADPNEPPPGRPASDWGSPLLWAIRRRCSAAHVSALLAAGARTDARTPDGVPARTLALRFGLTEVAAMLPPFADGDPRAADGSMPAADASRIEAFVAACARGDVDAARALEADGPRLADALDAAQQRLLPELAAAGCDTAVRTMVECGWSLEVRGGDIDATALNHALFRGDAALVRFLLAHGADWRTPHGFGDDARGTLSWASLHRPVADGDWPACAQALLDHGLPPARPDPAGSDALLIDGSPYLFEEEVAQLLSQGPARSGP